MNSEQINVILNDCFAKLEQISQKEKKQLTIQSYQNLKKIQKKARKLTTTWLKEDDEKAQIEARIDNLQQLLSETEKTFPEQIRIRANWLDKNKKRKIVPFCHHDQVYWPRDKGEHPCCLDCGDNKSRSFLHNLQFNYHRINIKDWLGYRGLDTRELKETRYQFGKLSKAEYTNVEQVQEAYLEIEEELSQIANEKNLDRSGIVADGDRCKDRKTKQLRERERERERANLPSMQSIFN
ncbi:hypothetical protein [endosymbiont GvMRE of Glomus versiforme]|uniref:hypothetical protein n=1 Tax=endosymbiont GvMRE of Glomus versiforme TaxID=2039283 RepID=UPI000EEC4F9B|nr:hypothetical protein [endosymbiont GvMRE of Glomus versiforme]RHZ36243.1 hypothetical protein GvMRE_Ic1g123 [endosymbiont GvMRE of Glomus versiforme]